MPNQDWLGERKGLYPDRYDCQPINPKKDVSRWKQIKSPEKPMIQRYGDPRQVEFRDILLSIGIKLQKTQISDIINSKLSQTIPIEDDNVGTDDETQGVGLEKNGDTPIEDDNPSEFED